jgi:hypothetical protein
VDSTELLSPFDVVLGEVSELCKRVLTEDCFHELNCCLARKQSVVRFQKFSHFLLEEFRHVLILLFHPPVGLVNLLIKKISFKISITFYKTDQIFLWYSYHEDQSGSQFKSGNQLQFGFRPLL